MCFQRTGYHSVNAQVIILNALMNGAFNAHMCVQHTPLKIVLSQHRCVFNTHNFYAIKLLYKILIYLLGSYSISPNSTKAARARTY